MRDRIALLILLAVCGVVFCTSHIGFANNAAYDEQEAIRRASQRLDAIDRGQKIAAQRRWDATHNSDSSDGAWAALIIVVALSVFVVSRKNKCKQNKSAKKIQKSSRSGLIRTDQERKRQKEELVSLLEIATPIGFTAKRETKDCPSCARRIQLRATICRHCRKAFLSEDIEKATREAVDRFLQEHEMTPR